MSSAPNRSPAAKQRAKKYRSARWQRIRASVLAQHPSCMRIGCDEPATVVDHFGGHDDGHPERFWHGPFVALCASCHSFKTAAIERPAGWWAKQVRARSEAAGPLLRGEVESDHALPHGKTSRVVPRSLRTGPSLLDRAAEQLAGPPAIALDQAPIDDEPAARAGLAGSAAQTLGPAPAIGDDDDEDQR